MGDLIMFRSHDMQGVIPYPRKFRLTFRLNYEPMFEIQAGIILPDGDQYMTWLPVFTKWWD